MPDTRSLNERRSRARKRALVVDGDVLARIELRLLLEMHGYQVDEAEDVSETMGWLGTPKLDLLILGNRLTGPETLATFMSRQPGLKMLFWGTRGIRSEMLQDGIAFLDKPCSLSALTQALDQVFRSGQGSRRRDRPDYCPHYPPR